MSKQSRWMKTIGKRNSYFYKLPKKNKWIETGIPERIQLILTMHNEAFFVQTFHLIVPSSIIACFPPFVQALGYGTVEKEASLFGFVLVFFNLCWLQNPSMWKPKYVQLKILLNNWWSLEYFLPSERNGGNITCTKEQVQQLHMSRGHQKNQGQFLIEEFSKSGASKVN